MKALALLLGLMAVGGPSEQLEVTRASAQIMERPNFIGKAAGKLVKGQKVQVLDRARYPWLKVQLKDKQGFVHASAFASARVNLAGAAEAVEAKGIEKSGDVNLAARGFDETTEKKYRADSPALEEAFGKVDEYLKADAELPTDEELRDFASTGKIVPAAATGGAP